MSILEELQKLAAKMEADPEPIRTIRALFQFKLGAEGTYQVLMQEGTVTVLEGDTSQANCTLTLSEADMRKLLKDELNTTLAFMTGKLKIEGNLGLAIKLQEVMKKYSLA
ncbi:SCP2 sterol-binding domain-containing protein [Gorillibacterium massiliense]|uniref:SCP2 sterol-binding domain-containing protein n=1 Tax=Gorillibacterium massiliense TaxID=1280390 RepID=UPI0004B4DCCA|nr:SCP2 sterol-binding domain-containing protein [Gorillibacterium massiliense]